jgi:hypothetical protein
MLSARTHLIKPFQQAGSRLLVKSQRLVCKAADKGTKYDKSTPDSVWKQLLSAEEVSKDIDVDSLYTTST